MAGSWLRAHHSTARCRAAARGRFRRAMFEWLRADLDDFVRHRSARRQLQRVDHLQRDLRRRRVRCRDRRGDRRRATQAARFACSISAPTPASSRCGCSIASAPPGVRRGLHGDARRSQPRSHPRSARPRARRQSARRSRRHRAPALLASHPAPSPSIRSSSRPATARSFGRTAATASRSARRPERAGVGTVRSTC